MATSTRVDEAEFVAPAGVEGLIFRRLRGREELGRVPEYRIDLLRPSKLEPLDPKDLLGKKGTVKLLLEETKFRYFNGVVTRFEQGGVTGRFDIYHLEMRPGLWYLTLGADCRIFQEKTALDIIKAVFNGYGSNVVLEDKLEGSFRTRPYTVQYRESDFAFVSRLMEEEGIYYYFKHEASTHKMVLCNSPAAHADIVGGSLLWATVQSENQYREDVIQQWSRAHSLRSLKYTHTDFAAEVPATDLKNEALRTAPYPAPSALEVFDYPGGYEDLAMADGKAGAKRTEAKRLAQLRVDAFESGHIVASAATACRHVAVGQTFTFKDYPKVGVTAGGYLVTRADFDMEFAGYEANQDVASRGFTCRFDAVPKTIKFQPQPVTTRPVISGPQTATVVGPSGDELHTDKYGRVKLFFHWDRVGKKDGTTSCWVRVSTPWASNKFGAVALPRIGDEVVVEFLEGNPDRPLITGRVYNGTNLPPWELPAHATVSGIKTRSSKGGAAGNANELRFEDKKGSEYVWLQAEKDFHQWVKNDSFDTVKRDRWTDTTRHSQHNVTEKYAMKVGKTATLKVVEDVSAKLGADFSLEVTGALGAKVDDAIAVKGAKAIALTAGQALDVDAGQTIKITGGSSVHIKGLGIVIDGGTSLTIKAGSGSVVLDTGGVTITGALVKINSGGSAGAANAAEKASPAAPDEPAAPAENKDPLA